MDWITETCAASDEAAGAAAASRQARLTKPPGALGRLEEIALRFAAWQGRERPEIGPVRICIFASDHGIAEAGVSLFPQAVTAEMVRNFAGGGAAISVLAREIGADLEVVNLGTVSEVEPLRSVLDERIAPGTLNFAREEAMSRSALSAALASGRRAASRAEGYSLFIGGEMGIANTTSASAIACALLDADPERLAGPGTGLDMAGVAHKAAVIGEALRRHETSLSDPLEILRILGGFEIAALAGAYIACAQKGIPVLVDGFISSVSALVASRINPGSKRWMFFAHASAEPGHRLVMAALDAEPLVDFGMRLGEGSGAACAVPIIRLACALHGGMATFAEAGVSEQA